MNARQIRALTRRGYTGRRAPGLDTPVASAVRKPCGGSEAPVTPLLEAPASPRSSARSTRCLASELPAGVQLSEGRGNPLDGGRNSKRLPLFSRDSCLTQQLRQESGADVAAVRIRDGQSKATSLHELVLAARIRSGEAQPAQADNQFASFDGAEVRHQAGTSTSLTVRFMPSNTGTGRLREMRNSSQSSSVLANSSRQASSVSACASTPSKPGISP